MAKIDIYIPEPKPQYDESNQRQILEALDTLKNCKDDVQVSYFDHSEKF